MVPKLPSRSLAEERSELLKRARSGSAEAWEELVSRFGGLVLSVARDHGLSEEDCEEAFQNTWIAFLGQIDLIQEPAAITGWLATTAKRQAWRIRRRSREGSSEEADLSIDQAGPGPEDHALGLERRFLVHEALAELSAHCRDLLGRLFLREDEPSYGDVAAELGVPLGSIGPTRMRCLARLAGALERRGFA